MKKVYQGMMGWKEQDEKHKGTHYLITAEELDDFKLIERERDCAERDLITAKQDVERRLRLQEAEAQENLRQQANEYEEKLKRYAEAYAKEKQLHEEAENLNVNLKRICRENANAKRGLKPKKKHSGFVVTATAEIFERVKVKKDMNEYRAYKSIVETPYSEFLPLTEQLKDGAWKDGLNELFDGSWKDTNNNNYLGAVNEDRQKKNFIYRQNWRTNKNGLWEIECFHTKPMNLT